MHQTKYNSPQYVGTHARGLLYEMGSATAGYDATVSFSEFLIDDTIDTMGMRHAVASSLFPGEAASGAASFLDF
jgi:hypothetical protein